MASHRPAVLSIAGHDPTGGAGIQADIETIACHGCHPCSIITSLTTQDTRDVIRVHCQDPEALIEQVRALLEDIPIEVIKVGFLGSAGITNALIELLDEHNRIPLIVDPVLVAGGGSQLANANLVETIISGIIPRALILTPNSQEARRLYPNGTNMDGCAEGLIRLGCQYILITGGHENTGFVINRLYSAAGLIQESQWPRLPQTYHGSGCTLSASIAANIALGEKIPDAVENAQIFTWTSLRAGDRPGRGQWIPNRITLPKES